MITEKNLKSKNLSVVSDSVYTVFLYVNEYKTAGDLQPYEYAKNRIKSILTEQNKNDFLRTYRKKLYEDGVRDGKAKRYK